MGDNRLFKINGKTREQLQQAMDLFTSLYNSPRTHYIEGWKVLPKFGFILYWAIPRQEKGIQKFPSPLNTPAACSLIWEWLQSEEGQKFENNEQWESNYDHDGSNSRGWTIYVEDWGHVADDSYALYAVRPSWLWHGK